MPFVIIDTNPLHSLPVGVGNDGGQLPWLGDVLIKDFLQSRANGLPLTRIDPLWDRDHASLPYIWPLTGDMQGE